MAEIVTADKWDEIQQSGPATYMTLKEDDGPVEIEILSPPKKTKKGKEDPIGVIWRYDNPKTEVEAFVDGDKKLFKLNQTFFQSFITHWKKQGYGPHDLKGTVWKVERTGKYDYDIEFIEEKDEATEEDNSSSSSSSSADEIFKQLKKAIIDLEDEDKLQEGIDKDSLIPILVIKTSLKSAEIEEYIPKLIDVGLLKETDDGLVIK